MIKRNAFSVCFLIAVLLIFVSKISWSKEGECKSVKKYESVMPMTGVLVDTTYGYPVYVEAFIGKKMKLEGDIFFSLEGYTATESPYGEISLIVTAKSRKQDAMPGTEINSRIICRNALMFSETTQECISRKSEIGGPAATLFIQNDQSDFIEMEVGEKTSDNSITSGQYERIKEICEEASYALLDAISKKGR